jgi:mRNA interferase MazF
MDMVVQRSEVWLVNLDPTVGREIGKSRPCVILSPDEANRHLQTVTAAPLTSTIKPWPTRVNCRFDGRTGQIAIDQIRAIDKERLIKRLRQLDTATLQRLFQTLDAYFRW